MNERLEALIKDIKEVSTISDLMDSGELGKDRLGDILISLTLFFFDAQVPPSDICIMLALHFGVLGAEMDEAVKNGATSQFPITFEEHLRLFCEYARVAYRDRAAAGFIEDHANVEMPKRKM